MYSFHVGTSTLEQLELYHGINLGRPVDNRVSTSIPFIDSLHGTTPRISVSDLKIDESDRYPSQNSNIGASFR